MRTGLLFAFSFSVIVLSAQPLTVEKIMQDPSWIGTQPNNISWSIDNKCIYFNWNPEKNKSDSAYKYVVASGKIEKAAYNEVTLNRAMQAGKYDNNHSRLVYVYEADIYLFNFKTGVKQRITRTEESETDPSFIQNDQWIAYRKGDNIYTWDISTGSTVQRTNFTKATPPATPAANTAGDGTGNRGRGAGRSGAQGTGEKSNTNQQEKWLEADALENSAVLKERKEKEDARKAFLKSVKSDDTLREIKIGDKNLMRLQLSPDGAYCSYVLYTAPIASKRTIVPDYVTESGFTTDINGRTKVGNTIGTYDFYLYDIKRDTVYSISSDSLPGITATPDYYADYPEKFKDKKATPRKTTMFSPVWNDAGTKAVVEFRSQDFKDRWLMILDPTTGKLSLADHQRDEAWIAGPGIDRGVGSNIGWVNNDLLYYQSEVTGYSHLYTYQTSSGQKNQLTHGKYEVQECQLSQNRQFFYLITNEEHPGKQNWYRIGVDGKNKQKITQMTGGYEVSMSPDEKNIAYRYSYSNKPWELYLQANQPGSPAKQLTNKSMSDDWKAYPWRDPEMVQITARDGGTIYARLYEPEPSKKNGAAVIFVHGAGYLQNVHYWWSSYFREYMFNNLLTDLGYTVIDADYRASKGYGRDWRTGIYRFMGGKDMTDNIDAIDWLIKNKGIDANRVGMYGGSYGGFMTLMTMFTAPDVVKAGAALRPVTDWAHYNHGYTAQILNEPFTDSIAYAKSSPINYAAGLKNNLLICHGMIDVNVNFQDAVRLTQKLIELGKDNWWIAPYPLEDHGFVEPSSWTDEYKRILKLFNSTLMTTK